MTKLIDEYFHKMYNIHTKIIDYLENDDFQENDLTNLIKFFEDQEIRKKKHELKDMLYLISKIYNNHHRSTNFIKKIELFLE